MDPTQNNNFGSQPSVGMGYDGNSTGVEMGDIVLSPEKKSKKWWIIGVAGIAVVIVIAACVVLFLMNSEKNGATNPRNVYEKFNVYANYLVDGAENTEDLNGEYVSYDWYALDEAIENEDDSFLQTADRLWDSFYEAFSNNEKLHDDAILEARVEAQNRMMEFIVLYNDVRELSEEEVLRMYIDKGFTDANDEVLRRYAPFGNMDYEKSAEYSNAEIERAKVLLEYLQVADQNGCLTESNLDDGCLEGKMSVDLMQRLMSNSSNNALKIPADVTKYIMYNCWEIAGELMTDDSASSDSSNQNNTDGGVYEE